MHSERQDRVAEQIAHFAAEFVRKEANTDPLITITRAEVAKDYKNGTIFFTTVPSERENDAAIFLKRAGGEMRRYIMKHMRIKHIPFLSFSVDYGERHRQNIDELVRKTGTESTWEEE